MIEKLLDWMRREGVAVETIVRVVPVGDKHVGFGMFRKNFAVTFDDGRTELWYPSRGRAYRREPVYGS